MQISTTTIASDSGNPRSANILRQIRRLEEKKAELMKKLTKSQESGEKPAADLGRAGMRMGDQSIAGQTAGLHTPGQTAGAALPGTGADSGESVPDAAAPAPSGGVLNLGEVLRSVGSAMSSGQGGSDDFAGAFEQPKDIMKRIQMLDMQIMMLRQQLGEDAMSVLAANPDADKDASEFIDPSLLHAASAELPEPVVTAEGHVDGYA